jgi:hypothetical protein
MQDQPEWHQHGRYERSWQLLHRLGAGRRVEHLQRRAFSPSVMARTRSAVPNRSYAAIAVVHQAPAMIARRIIGGATTPVMMSPRGCRLAFELFLKYGATALRRVPDVVVAYYAGQQDHRLATENWVAAANPIF